MKKTGLIILDGWGYREEKEHNAIALAHTPNFDELFAQHPHTLLEACGQAVGLPDGQMGNSEVGHIHIGAGRIIPQSLSLINQSAANNFADRQALITQLQYCKQHNKALHILGLLSDGGVHSHEKHIFSLLRLCKEMACTNVYIHVFSDGRDTSPTASQHSIRKLEALIAELNIGNIASICGRFYAMDRDNRWQRTEMAHQLIIEKQAPEHATDAAQAIQNAYQQGLTDEFIKPTLIGNHPAPTPEDVLIFMNFRVDRARQLTQSLVTKTFKQFPIKQTFKHFITLTQYHPDYPVDVIFPPYHPKNCLGEHIANLGLRQLRIAETEKYPHVTFFLNGGRNICYDKEQQILIPSPQVATYDLAPKMSAEKIKNRLIQAIQQDETDVFIANFANTDMVGHSGDLQATIEAAEMVDTMLGEICTIAKQHHWQLIITADHGNADIMLNSSTGEPHTAHTLSLVPLIIYNSAEAISLKNEGTLTDIAPTMLQLMGQPYPEEMTGTPLFHPA